MKPFLKWAGGKTQLLPEIVSRLPGEIDYYIEPFLGGGAVFLHLLETGRIKRSVLTDKNQALINVWNTIKDDEDRLIQQIEMIECEFNHRPDKREYYYNIREEFNFRNQFQARIWTSSAKVRQAAIFIFLNKTNYNGLFRVNKNGLYNVPYGGRKSFNVDKQNIREIAAHIRENQIHFVCVDFSWILDVIGAFIYLDPPYITDDGFTSYSGEFGMFDQKRLAKLVEYISPRNKVMVSNSFHPVVNDLYFGFTMHVVQATRRINRDGSGRGKVDEVIITNYDIQNQ